MRSKNRNTLLFNKYFVFFLMFDWLKKKKKEKTLKSLKAVHKMLNKDNDPYMDYMNKQSQAVMSEMDLDLPSDQFQAELSKRLQKRMSSEKHIKALMKITEQKFEKKKKKNK